MPNPLQKLYLKLADTGCVLDVGCIGFRQVGEAKQMGRPHLRHFGVDYVDLSEQLPEAFVFSQADLSKESIPFADDSFDLVVASHIIEHLPNPIDFFGECVRVCRPGGWMYFEAPSERSLLFPGMPFKHESFFSLSFYDDPTHTFRPWTPQSLHRLSRYFACEPIETGYRVSWKHRLAFPLTIVYALLTSNGSLLERACWYAVGWASYLIVQKPQKLAGKPAFHYYIPVNR